MKKFTFFTMLALALVCLTLAASADSEIFTSDTLTLTKRVTENVGGSVAALEVFYADEQSAEIQEKVNLLLNQTGDIASHQNTLALIQNADGWGIHVDFKMNLYPSQSPQYLSVVYIAEGKMPNGRYGQKNTCVTIDLLTGERVTAKDIFSDLDAAQSALDAYAEEYMAGDLSTYMENADVTPVMIENFFLDDFGITFYYDSSQVLMLSGYAGAMYVLYPEMSEHLALSDGAVLTQMGLGETGFIDTFSNDAETVKEKIDALMEKGWLVPDWNTPLRLESAYFEIEDYRQMYDADRYPNGYCYQVEEAVYRDFLIITDENGNEVTALQSRHLNLYGLITGESTRQDVTDVMGEPDASMQLNDETAESYYMAAGYLDSYDANGRKLSFNFDEENILRAVKLQ